MEVGKLILNAIKKKATMTVSVKPFGCMPSSGVSDGVQTIVTEKYPGTIFCAVETSGDGRVNFYSRIQMFLFKARLAAKEEVDTALRECGVTLEEVRAFLEKNPRFASPLHKPPHVVASTTADLVYEVAPYIKKTRLERAVERAKGAAVFAKVEWERLPARWEAAREMARKAPGFLRQVRAEWKDVSPALQAKVAEEIRNRFGEAFFASATHGPDPAAAGDGASTVRMAAMK
jgi:hypothetical protein